MAHMVRSIEIPLSKYPEVATGAYSLAGSITALLSRRKLPGLLGLVPFDDVDGAGLNKVDLTEPKFLAVHTPSDRHRGYAVTTRLPVGDRGDRLYTATLDLTIPSKSTDPNRYGLSSYHVRPDSLQETVLVPELADEDVLRFDPATVLHGLAEAVTEIGSQPFPEVNGYAYDWLMIQRWTLSAKT